MRKTVFTSIVMALIAAFPALLAAQGADSTSGKIAVMNMQVAIASTGAGKQALSNLQKKYAPKQQDLQQQEKSVEALQNRLQDQSAMLTDDQKYQLNVQLEQQQRRLKEAQDDDTADFQADQNEAVRQLMQKMQKLVAQYAQQHNFALVLGEQSIPVYYAAKTIDITQKMVDLYNSTYPVAAAPSAANRSPAPAKGDQPKP